MFNLHLHGLCVLSSVLTCRVPLLRTGTYRWMAPEIIRHQPYSEKADVYSFGITLWQLLTREEPFAFSSPIEAAGKVALELARPPFPNKTPIKIQTLIRNCWAEEPEKRLGFEEICKQLRELKITDPEEQRWLQASMGHPAYQYDQLSPEEVEQPQQQLQVPKPSSKPAKGLRKLFSSKTRRNSGNRK